MNEERIVIWHSSQVDSKSFYQHVRNIWKIVVLYFWKDESFLFLRPNSHTIYIFAQNIDIKIYWNKKIKKDIFPPIFFSCVNWKYLFMDNYAYWNLVWKYFKMSLQYFEEKNFFLSKFSSKYIFNSMLRAKILCVTRALTRLFMNFLFSSLTKLRNFKVSVNTGNWFQG